MSYKLGKASPDESMEYNYKKAVTTMLILSVLNKSAMRVKEIVDYINRNNLGAYTVSDLNAAVYRIEQRGSVIGERMAIDTENHIGRIYNITPEGRKMLKDLYRKYWNLTNGTIHILKS